MTLRTVQVPDPPAGQDWVSVVPGQYLYNITGITATLTSTSGPSPVAHDSSGNGQDGSYFTPVPPTLFVPGLVAGDLGLQLHRAGPAPNTEVLTPPDIIDWLNPFSIAFLWQNTIGPAVQTTPFISAGGPPNQILWLVIADAGAGPCFFGTQVNDWRTAAGAIPHDNLPHLIVVTWDGAVAVLYVDAVVVPWAHVGTPPGAPIPLDVAELGGNGGPNSFGILDEYALFNFALPAGIVAGIQAARGGGFATYSPYVLGLGPSIYYHLDDFVTGGPHQVTLAVSNGTLEVVDVPTGFPLASGPGPYRYSWQPNLNSSTQSPDGSLTTVAIPPLVLPAGYALETITLDLFPTDQWSNVTIWWNDDYMVGLGQLPPYVNTLLLPADWAGFPR